jgi:CRP-like cAMP-binding protein
MDISPANRTILRYVGAFSSLSDPDCDAVLLLVKERRLIANEVLFRQGDAGDSMVIVHHGSLSVRARRPDGYDAEVARIASGEVLGELCCVDPAPRSASVVAISPAMVCELHATALARLREVAPAAYAAVMSAIIHDISRRTRDVDARAAALLSPGAPKAPSQAPPRVASSQAPPRVPTQPPAQTASQAPSKLSSRAPPRTSFPSPPPEEPAEEPGAVRRFLDRLRGLS